MSGLLQELVTKQAQTRPDATALVHGKTRLTYRELDEASDRLAAILKASGCVRGDRVCFLLPKSPEAIIAMLGILKADCMHVPLDASSPAPRLARIVASCEPRLVLATAAAAKLLEELLAGDAMNSIGVGWMDDGADGPRGGVFARRDLVSGAGGPHPYANRPHDGAHILFTSGSTGHPKGVVITHANVIAFVKWATEYFRIDAGDRLSGHPPLHFDLSTFDVFGAFAAGAQLHLVPPELSLVPQRLAAFIRSSELTQWFSVPSVLQYMAKFDVVATGDFPALKRLLWCGEVLPTPVLTYWMGRLPGVQFTNLYGPTEATIASAYYTVPRCPADDRVAIPIGEACGGEELQILDDGLQPVPRGEIGNLFIGGVGLSPGYWQDAEKTDAVFLRDPKSADPASRIYKTGDLARIGDDGLVYFLGRADSQIKSRGYRIELGEIECALNAIGLLKACAVVGVPTEGFEGTAICCAYVPHTEATTASVLRRELTKMLPSYMIPSQWAALPELPGNANGKVDRRKLKEQFASAIAAAAVRGPASSTHDAPSLSS